MTGLDIFALIVLFIIACALIAVVVFMGVWLGIIAKKRNHPYAEAVAIGGWVGLIFGGVLWPVILIWAYTSPPTSQRELSDMEMK